jgi:hypothetical protein
MFMRALRASSVINWIERLKEVGFSPSQAEALIKLIQDMYEEITGEREIQNDQ